jgi:hypothetical protein
MRVVVMLWLLLIASCASHPPRVDCEGHLKPINPPARTANPDGTRESRPTR